MSGQSLVQTTWGKTYYNNVYPDYMTGAFSYMNQKTNSIEMGVSSGQVLAAFNMTATPDGSKINMTADRINMDAQVFAHAISAQSAMLGGICLGYGVISASNGNNKWILKDDGTGFFTGDIVANSLTLGGVPLDPSGSASDPNALKKDVVVSGVNGNLFSVSSDGLLRADNAIINGTIVANDGVFKGRIEADEGYFQGQIEASDIVLNGHSIILSGDGNTFEISNAEIDVVDISKTITVPSSQSSNQSAGQSTVPIYGQFTPTGNTIITLQPIPFKQYIYAGTIPGTYGDYYTMTDSITVETFVVSGQSPYMQNIGVGQPGVVTYHSATTVHANQNNNGNTSSNTNYVPFTTGNGLGQSNSTYSFTAIDGKVYYVGYRVTHVYSYNQGDRNNSTASTEVYSTQFEVTPSGADKTFTRIGRNGMQIFLPGGFSLTAAYSRTSSSSVIQLIGHGTNNNEFGIMLDRTQGLRYKNPSDTSWKNFS